MNLSHLSYFKRLAEVKHYTKAAAELYIAQPTLSVAISSLEKELGVKLFYRENNKILLTPCGKEFYKYISIALANIEKGISAAQDYNSYINAHLNLGVLYAMQGNDWSQFIQSFTDEYPGEVDVEITQGFTPTLLNGLGNANLDVVFSGKPSNDPSLSYTHVWAQELAVAVNKAHPFASRTELSLDDLKDCHILTYHPQNAVYKELQGVLKDRDLSIDYGYNDEITLSSLVTSNKKDVALLCYSFLVKAFDDVVFLPLKEAPKEFHKVYLIYKKDANHPRVVRDFIDFTSKYQFPTATVRSLKYSDTKTR